MLESTEVIPLPDSHAEIERLHDGLVTGRNVAALPGIDCHPKHSPTWLYHHHAKIIEMKDPPESGLFRRGRWSEGVAPIALAEVRPDLTFEKGRVFIRNQRVRAGATPDGFITDKKGRRGPTEIKSCSRTIFDRFYREPGTAAPNALIQVLLPMWLLDAPVGWIIALQIDEFNPEIRIVEIEPHQPSFNRLEASLKYHWQCVDEKREPEVELTAVDRELMAQVFARETAAKMVDLSTNNEIVSALHERAELRDKIKAAEERCKAIEATLMAAMGDAERAAVPNFRVSWKTEPRKGYAVEPSNPRVLRIRPTGAAA